MPEIELTPLQQEAIDALKVWYHSERRERQIFRLFGYAGTGKTTITQLALSELGVRYRAAAFTGKAALVMSRNGTPATTIHRMIYKVREDDKGNIRFELDPDSEARRADLIVLDEVSMVNAQLGKDLESFKTPILVIGDPGQLPPIEGAGYFTDAQPDYMLDEIHRQAAGNPIIKLATMARKQQFIPYGAHGQDCVRVRDTKLNPDQLLRADQVIVGRNNTRIALNNMIREALGFPHFIPQGIEGEKLICLRNNYRYGLLNGQFFTIDEVEDRDEVSFYAYILTEDGKVLHASDDDAEKEGTDKIPIYKGHFEDHDFLDKERFERDRDKKRGLIEATWGYAITCHKSQGSQWDNVILLHQPIGREPADRARWLYTGITRAASKLVIVG